MGSHTTPTPAGSFTGTPTRRIFHGILSDLDGTIIDSTDAIVKHWHLIGKELGFDPDVVLATSHGRRSIDTLQVLDPSKANWEYVHKIEARIPAEYGQDAKEVPGAKALLARLTESDAPWAIVTSGSRPLVDGWLKIMNLPHPNVLVTAEDVKQGKPDPACYNLGRSRIGLETHNENNPNTPAILVLEDAPSGIRAGKAAGCTVLALATTHSIESVLAAGADYVVRDLESLKVLRVGKGEGGEGLVEVEVEISDSWVAGATSGA